MTDDARCEFETTKPLGAMSQSARRGSRVRYARCKNRATQTITLIERSLAWENARTVKCCALHKRLHEEQGWRP